MFAYCNSNPVNFQDDAGTRLEYVRFDCGAPVGLPSPSTVSSVTPSGGSGKRKTLPIEFALVEETAMVKGGRKTASILSGEFDMYSLDDGGFNLLSFEASVVSLDLENEKRRLSLFNLGNVSASAGIGILPYASVLVSEWSPSVTFPLFKKQVTIELHVGAVGIGYKFTATEFKATFANGIGMSIGVT